ncbi:MAG: molybdopterin adenylyltransferase [Dehalococcoidales bacterium]|nr:molybdopterin adenylyltransferase [Dehalococcoidales bacterium]
MISVGILTVSDKGSQGKRADISGDTIKEMVCRLPASVVKYAIVPDEKDVIGARLMEWADGGGVDIILTTGGTGLAERDVTPEATLAVIEKAVPGIAEAMRAKSLEKTPLAMLSRMVAGVRGKCLIVNLPGSPKAVRECLEVVLPALPHAVDIIKGRVTEHPETSGLHNRSG